MHITLFILYSILFCYGIVKLPFLRHSGIRPNLLIAIFTLHVAVGCLHNIIAWRYYPDHGDIWDSFQRSLILRNLLHNDFHRFLLVNSNWNYFTHNGIVFIDLLLNFLTADNIYIDTLLFAFPVFLGNIALYLVFRRYFPTDPLAAISTLLLPSTLFWTACLSREGALYVLLGFLFYHLDRLFTGTGRRSFYYTIVFFLLIVYFRIAIAIILIPALLVWWGVLRRLSLTGRWPLEAAIFVVIALILFIPAVREPLLRSIATEQASFQVLEGHSRLPLPALDGTLASVWHAFPDAVRNGFFEPLPGSGGQPVYLAFSFELILIWLFVLLAAFRPRSPAPALCLQSPAPAPRPASAAPTSAFPAACLLFALAGMLTIGFFVPFAGALVRYRSIYLPFLLAPALHTLRGRPLIQRLNRWLNNRLQFLI